MEHYYHNTVGEDWFDYSHFYKEAVRQCKDNSHFVEVGTWKGRSACFMGVEIINSGKNIKFDCVDTWEHFELQKDIPENLFKEDVYQIFLKNIEPIKHIIKPIKKISWEGAALYNEKSLDFIFIDAGHDYESVKKDLNAWYPKLKNNGVIAGHDFFNSEGVATAVKEMFNDNFLTSGSCWYFNNK